VPPPASNPPAPTSPWPSTSITAGTGDKQRNHAAASATDPLSPRSNDQRIAPLSLIEQ
jgi:hypothetical protein